MNCRPNCEVCTRQSTSGWKGHQCAECGVIALEVTRRPCANKHFICGGCWSGHIPQYTECPACDGLIEEGKGHAS